MINTSMIKVGDKVGVMRGGSFGYTHCEGLYTITKIDKVKVVVEQQRETGCHVRKFNKRGYETGKSYTTSFLVTQDEYQDVVDQVEKARTIRTAWQNLEKAVSNHSITDAEAFIKELKVLTK